MALRVCGDLHVRAVRSDDVSIEGTKVTFETMSASILVSVCTLWAQALNQKSKFFFSTTSYVPSASSLCPSSMYWDALFSFYFTLTRAGLILQSVFRRLHVRFSSNHVPLQDGEGFATDILPEHDLEAMLARVPKPKGHGGRHHTSTPAASPVAISANSRFESNFTPETNFHGFGGARHDQQERLQRRSILAGSETENDAREGLSRMLIATWETESTDTDPVAATNYTNSSHDVFRRKYKFNVITSRYPELILRYILV